MVLSGFVCSRSSPIDVSTSLLVWMAKRGSMIGLGRRRAQDAAHGSTDWTEYNKRSGVKFVEHAPRPPVCTENLNANVMVMKSAQDRA